MKNVILCWFIASLVCSCVDTSKPQNFISEDKMLDILYDMNVLQSIRSNNYQLFNTYDLNPEEFIYKKYNIDSLQFVQNHKYYISDMDNYQKIIEKLIKRAEKHKDSISAKNSENSTEKDLLEKVMPME